MKVLYFHQHFVSPKGAGAIRSYAMAHRLIAAGNQVTIVCGSALGSTTGLSGEFSNGCRRGFVDGIEVVEFDLSYSNKDRFLKRTFTFLRYAMRSVLAALREDCDVVFATSTPLTAGIPGIVARWLRRKPFVFEVRDLWPELPREMKVITNPFLLWALGVLEWVSYHSADRLVGLSPGIVEGINRRGVPNEKITLIPNGCDLDLFSTDITAWRPSTISDTDFLAIYAGTHGLANGLEAVIDAATVLKKRGVENIKVLLIGSGQLKSKLEKRVVSEGLDNVVFHDAVPKKELAGLFKSADLGLQILANIPAFYFGTSPNKFFDYISAGLPVLTNYPGWLSNIIKNHDCGYCVSPEDPEGFADALEAMSKSPNRNIIMGKNARLLAETQFDRNYLSGLFLENITKVAS